MIFISVHCVGCFWYLVSELESFDFNTTWVWSRNIQDANIIESYMTSVYWSFSTVLTVGYGDVSAHTDFERIFSIIWMMLGVAFYTFTISTLTSIIG
mmetsp:Transcript_2402/g.1659  ORF Transcript_2402/g.1659 Transcript_2402/m.1659 type:complete len:97 (+) Transcript_2402:130-420(+)